jgi:hypothetical protein
MIAVADSKSIYTSAAEWREQAQQARLRAEVTSDPAVRHALLAKAKNFDALALLAEKNSW